MIRFRYRVKTLKLDNTTYNQIIQIKEIIRKMIAEINNLPSIKLIIEDAIRMNTSDEPLSKLVSCETIIRE